MSDPLAFLEALTGEWDLTGTMGDDPLHHAVEARWSLGGSFLEMRFTDRIGSYEAVAFIGYIPDRGVFAMHLLDTTGVYFTCPVGIGALDGNRIDFVFEYADGPFHNVFTHHDDGTWTMELGQEFAGVMQPFATKHLRRVGD